MKPILFNTEMVKAIMDGRKTVTRRLIKPQPGADADLWYAYAGGRKQDIGKWHDRKTGQAWNPPYHADDILYVREAWAKCPDLFGEFSQYIYRANYSEAQLSQEETAEETFSDFPACVRWKPSIHMPKEAARIFLRVKSVRVKRLQAITVKDAVMESIDSPIPEEGSEELCNYCPLEDEVKGVHCYGGVPVMCEGRCCSEAMDAWEEEFIGEFAELWDSTIKPSELDTYGWEANPWVWVIEFERISKEEALK